MAASLRECALETTDLRLPDGFVVQLRTDLVHADDGKVLIGGSPLRAARLSDRARNLIHEGMLEVRDPASAALARRLLAGNLADPILDAVEVSSTDLTVVIPVRDRVEQLDRCLAALGPLGVLVVDDASAHPAAVARVARRHGAQIIALRENLGPAGARNAGLTSVTTPLVAFVDSDVVIGHADLLRLARHCRDPRVALVGPTVAGETRSESPRWFERYDAASSSLDLGTVGGQVRAGATVGWLPSACLIGRVAHLGAGFDENWRVAEDVDLVWRLVDAGMVVRYDPSVRARHDVRPTLGSWLGRKFVYGTGGAALAVRHGDKVAPAALSLPIALAAAGLLQRRWWSGPVAAVAVLGTARSLRPRLPVGRGDAVVASRLSARGLAWGVRQESALLLRHWWPATAVAALVSRAVRRSVLTAVVVDLLFFLRERRGVGPGEALVARRLDDLAYGAGLWSGAVCRRDFRCLVPRVLRTLSGRS